MIYSSLPTTRLRAVDNSVLMLLNDMATVTEARCLQHGVGGGPTANSAAALLPCIGIEMVAQRTRPAAETSNDEAIRRVFREVAGVTGYPAYGTTGFPIFKMIRNGLAHGFYPNSLELANGLESSATVHFWLDGHTGRSICVDTLGERVASKHLVLQTQGQARIVLVSLQHWYVDVKSYLEQFRAKLAADAGLQAVVELNDERLESEAMEGLKRQITMADSIALGI